LVAEKLKITVPLPSPSGFEALEPTQLNSIVRFEGLSMMSSVDPPPPQEKMKIIDIAAKNKYLFSTKLNITTVGNIFERRGKNHPFFHF
jgi:hypothetical protein